MNNSNGIIITTWLIIYFLLIEIDLIERKVQNMQIFAEKNVRKLIGQNSPKTYLKGKPTLLFVCHVSLKTFLIILIDLILVSLTLICFWLITPKP